MIKIKASKKVAFRVAKELKEVAQGCATVRLPNSQPLVIIRPYEHARRRACYSYAPNRPQSPLDDSRKD